MKYHPITFYVAPDMGATALSLTQYVDDMNTILAKNTDRRLIYDGYVITDDQPHDETVTLIDPCPIWVHIQKGNIPDYTTGGHISCDSSGAGVIAGMVWGQVYGTYCLDYSKQVYTMLHEIAHLFGAGIGEYYSLLYVPDQSGRAPLLGIDMTNTANPFAAAHLDWRGDPLLWNVGRTTRADFLNLCRFSLVSSLTINSNWRFGIDTYTSFTVRIYPRGGAVLDIPFTYYVYSKGGELLQSGTCEEEFTVTGWGAYRNADNLAKLVKVYQGARFIGQKWVCAFDVDELKLSGKPAVILV